MSSGEKSSSFRYILLVLVGAVIAVLGYQRLQPPPDGKKPAPTVASDQMGVINEIQQVAEITYQADAEGNVILFAAGVPEFTDEVATKLAQFPKLQKLTLSESGITDEALKTVGSLPNIERLLLERTAVTQDGLRSLTGLDSINHLSLAGCTLGPGALEQLNELSSLEILDLRQTDISDEELRFLKDLPNLKRLYLHQTSISGAGLDTFQKHKNLMLINISSVPVTQEGINNLRGLANLEQLYMDDVQFDDELLTALVDVITESLPKLQGLSIDRTPLQDSATEILVRLAPLPELALVKVTDTNISKRAFGTLVSRSQEVSFLADYPEGYGREE